VRQSIVFEAFLAKNRGDSLHIEPPGKSDVANTNLYLAGAKSPRLIIIIFNSFYVTISLSNKLYIYIYKKAKKYEQTDVKYT